MLWIIGPQAPYRPSRRPACASAWPPPPASSASTRLLSASALLAGGDGDRLHRLEFLAADHVEAADPFAHRARGRRSRPRGPCRRRCRRRRSCTLTKSSNRRFSDCIASSCEMPQSAISVVEPPGTSSAASGIEPTICQVSSAGEARARRDRAASAGPRPCGSAQNRTAVDRREQRASRRSSRRRRRPRDRRRRSATRRKLSSELERRTGRAPGRGRGRRGRGGSSPAARPSRM